MARETIDVKTLTEAEIIEAITYHCRVMKSFAYYRKLEIARWREKPEGLQVYRDDEGKLHAYYRA